MSRNVREWTCRLLEMVDDGVLDPKMALEMCTSYMSEDEVEDMMRINDLKQYFEDEEEEADPMDDFNYVGNKNHY